MIPHEYVDGKNHGKQESGGFVWDMQIDAAGQEAQLDELKSRWYAWQQERWTELSENYKSLPPAVYTQDKDWDDDPHRLFVFANEATLKKVRWRHFLADCNPLMAEFSLVENRIASKSPSHFSFPRSLRIACCLFFCTSNLSPCSTASFFVVKPVV